MVELRRVSSSTLVILAALAGLAPAAGAAGQKDPVPEALPQTQADDYTRYELQATGSRIS